MVDMRRRTKKAITPDFPFIGGFRQIAVSLA
jgi:hypothetical protein